MIFLDQRLPDCSDFRLLSALNKAAPGAATIVMSANADTPGFEFDALRLGANTILLKPFYVLTVPAFAERANRDRNASS